MKKLIAVAVLLVTLYLIVTDGMLSIFHLDRVYQYAFNFGAIFIILPASTFTLVGYNQEEETR